MIKRGANQRLQRRKGPGTHLHRAAGRVAGGEHEGGGRGGDQHGVAHPALQRSDAALLDYILTTSDGTVFDSSETHGGPQPFTMDQVFPGFAEAMERIFTADQANCLELTPSEWDARDLHRKFTESFLGPLRPLL